MINSLYKFFQITANEKSMLIEALLLSLYIRLLILFVPFRKLEKHFGVKTETYSPNKIASNQQLLLIKKTIMRLRNRTPWRYKCYEQSLTALQMLKRRKLPYTLYFGLNKEKQKLLAHVWIESNNYSIVPKGNKKFAVLSIYKG